ncbi:multidrug effflux MFS transporter [Piscinibacter sakaiensis]|uniref:multidrug effflux MFS transporter n=1 Tax=Piscinibacter sakaiensis TaxID=1547922 RepID=UPI003AAD91EC
MSPATVVVLLTLLLGIQPVTTDLYLPTLPPLQFALDASVAATQLTLSALIISFGIAQLIAGPLADRFGRRPLLLGGLAIYVAASIGGMLAPNIEALIAWRVLQGAAMAAAVNGGRAIVRDLYGPAEGASMMARALSGLGLFALASPIIGGAIAQWSSWRVALLMTALFGAATLVFVARRFPETIPVTNPHATRLAPMVGNWRQVLAHPTFRAWAALSATTFAGLFLILAGSSFVYIGVLGISRLEYGLLMAAGSVSYIAGTLACRRWLHRHGLLATVKRGAWVSLAGGVGMAAFALAGVYTVWAVFLPQCLFGFGHGIHQPCSQVGALAPFPDKAGAASAMSGFLMMLTAFVAGLWLGENLDGTPLPLGLGVGFFCVLLFVVVRTMVVRHGEPAAATLPVAR